MKGIILVGASVLIKTQVENRRDKLEEIKS